MRSMRSEQRRTNSRISTNACARAISVRASGRQSSMLLCATLSASHARHLAPHTRSGQTRRLLVCMKLSGSILRPDGPRRPVVCTLSRANGPPGPCGTRPRCLGSIFMRLDQPCLALSCSGGGWERGKGGRCVRSEATGQGGGVEDDRESRRVVRCYRGDKVCQLRLSQIARL